MLTVNLDSWKALSSDQQQQVTAVATKMEPGFWANWMNPKDSPAPS